MVETQVNSRQLGARVAGHAVLQEIRTFSLSANLARQPADGTLSYEFEPELDHEQVNETVLVIDGRYRLSIAEHEDGGSEAESAPLAEIRFTLSSLYSLRGFETPDSPPFSEEELAAFAATTGQFAMYPYARALVSDLIGRLGLPPLTLPMLKIDITDEVRRRAEQTALTDTSNDESETEASPSGAR